MTLLNPISTARRLDPRSMLRRGRASAETLVRENIPHVAIPRVTVEVERAPRRRRGLSMIIVFALLTLAAAVIVYLIWQRRDHEHAQLVTEPERPDATPATPSEPDASPPAAPEEPPIEPPLATSFTPPAAADDDGDGDEADEDAPETEPETAPPAREPVTARATAASAEAVASAPAEVASLSSPRAEDSVARRVERRLHLPGATAIAMPASGINLPVSRPGTPPRA